jgi:hypothetical protein
MRAASGGRQAEGYARGRPWTSRDEVHVAHHISRSIEVSPDSGRRAGGRRWSELRSWEGESKATRGEMRTDTVCIPSLSLPPRTTAPHTHTHARFSGISHYRAALMHIHDAHAPCRRARAAGLAALARVER